MRIHTRPAIVAVAAISLLAVPVQAQDSGTTVSFDGTGFTFDVDLGTSVSVTRVPAGPLDEEIPGGPDVPHVTFTLYGQKGEFDQTPRVGNAETTVRVYRVADLAGNEFAAQQAADLQQLLAERPDLTATEAVASDGSVAPLPFLPAIPAAQVVHARGSHVDLPGLSGVAYLTAFRQDVAPFIHNDFQYTFQGLTTDGAWYVSVNAIVDTELFPRELRPVAFDTIAKRWPRYLSKTIQTLDGAVPTDFTPSLDVIDALIATLTVGGVPASEPGPLASPAPSLLPSPSASPAA